MFLTRTKLTYSLKKKCVENGYVNLLLSGQIFYQRSLLITKNVDKFKILNYKTELPIGKEIKPSISSLLSDDR